MLLYSGEGGLRILDSLKINITQTPTVFQILPEDMKKLQLTLWNAKILKASIKPTERLGLLCLMETGLPDGP